HESSSRSAPFDVLACACYFFAVLRRAQISFILADSLALAAGLILPAAFGFVATSTACRAAHRFFNDAEIFDLAAALIVRLCVGWATTRNGASEWPAKSRFSSLSSACIF